MKTTKDSKDAGKIGVDSTGARADDREYYFDRRMPAKTAKLIKEALKEDGILVLELQRLAIPAGDLGDRQQDRSGGGWDVRL